MLCTTGARCVAAASKTSLVSQSWCKRRMRHLQRPSFSARLFMQWTLWRYSHIKPATLTAASAQSTRSSQFHVEYAFWPPLPGAEVKPLPLTIPLETSSSPTESSLSVLVRTITMGIPHLCGGNSQYHRLGPRLAVQLTCYVSERLKIKAIQCPRDSGMSD